MKNVFYLIIMVLIVSCTKEDISTNDNITDVPVVQSYLEPGNLVKVKLTKMLPFVEGGNSGVETIDSAKVYITNNGDDYLLLPVTNSRGEYENLDANLQISPDEIYKIYFEYNGYEVSASTVIPGKPVNASLNTSVYYVDPNATGPGSVTQEPIVVSWDNPNNSFYIVVVEYLETNYSPINGNLPEDQFDSYREVSTDPINDNSINLTTRQQLVFFGHYRVILFNINEEYVNLYENISQSTLNMSEPLTNINNGLGIFTGINSDTLFLRVKEL